MANAKRRALVAGATLSASALFAASAQAAGNTYTVTTTGDNSGSVPTPACTGSGGSYSCSTLRDAITAANSDSNNDTITFASGLNGTITIAGSPLPAISHSGGLTIEGPGAGTLTVSGNNTFDVFLDSAGGAVTISGLTVTDGNSGSAPGGAIENDMKSALTLSGDVVSGSTSASSVGGGGVYSDGPLSVSATTISGNTASAGAGGGIALVNPVVGYPRKYQESFHSSVDGSSVTGNTASGNGGAISERGGSLAVTGTTLSGNTSGAAGGGIYSHTGYGTTVSGSRVSGNTAAAGGGLDVSSDSFTGGGGAYYNPVAVDSSTISGNQAPMGAGIDLAFTGPGSPVSVFATTISGNHGGSNSFGGGLLIPDDVYSHIGVVDSTISGNSAIDGGGVSLGYGGTTQFLGETRAGSVAFENSTIAANTASSSGGGIYLGQYNTGSGAQGTSATIRSTIVSGNAAAGSPQDLDQAVSSSGGLDAAFSLVQNPANAAFLSQNAVITGKDPQLGPLQNNGGPTDTMMPSGTSPVIDQGHAPLGLTTDQRGDPRTVPVTGIQKPPGGDGTDIGSVELPASAVVVPTPPPQPPPSRAGFSASIRGQLIGGAAIPPLVHGATRVDCTVKTGTLSSCSVEIRASGGKLLARGESTTTSPVKSLSTRVSLTGYGRRALYHHPLGLIERADVFGATSASGEQEVTGKVLLLHPFVRLTIGTRAVKLPPWVLARIAKAEQIFMLAGAKSATCTAFTDQETGDETVTKAQAKAACHALRKDGFTGRVRSVGKGHSHAVAPNTTAKERAKNRRLIITFSF
jgi:hypothetical protein